MNNKKIIFFLLLISLSTNIMASVYHVSTVTRTTSTGSTLFEVNSCAGCNYLVDGEYTGTVDDMWDFIDPYLVINPGWGGNFAGFADNLASYGGNPPPPTIDLNTMTADFTSWVYSIKDMEVYSQWDGGIATLTETGAGAYSAEWLGEYSGHTWTMELTTPVPLPTSLWLFASGLLFIGRAVIRR